MKTPSTAQARLLASAPRGGGGVTVTPNGYIPATVRVCAKRGWLSPTDDRGVHPSGQAWIRYAVSPDGLRALGRALTK